MIRRKAAEANKKDGVIKWRSHEPSRLETFSDAVFAFAVTLIVVSLEVPRSFDELFETMKGFISFGACFTILFMIWNSQNIFFRRYGLADTFTTVINAMLLFVVLIYVYPLKFLFNLLFSFSDQTYTDHGQTFDMIHEYQQPILMSIYAIGYLIIYLLFYLMYRHAAKNAEEIELTPRELYETKTAMYINMMNAGIGLIAVIVAIALPARYAGLSGFTFFFIPFTYSFWFGYRGRKARKLFPTNP
jgi:uncharacterized membrane protein